MGLLKRAPTFSAALNFNAGYPGRQLQAAKTVVNKRLLRIIGTLATFKIKHSCCPMRHNLR